MPPRRRAGRISALLACLFAMIVGAALIVIGLIPEEPEPAPLPSTTFTVSSGSWARSSPPPPGAASSAAQSVPAIAPNPEPTRATDTIAPNRLVVDSLGVDAPLTPEALDGDELVIPGDPGTVGWWTGGAALNAKSGTTLLAGHVDRDGRLGALHGLYRVRPGARVYLSDTAGQITTWRVVSLDVRPKAALPTFPVSGPRRLAIVTCGGAVETTSEGRGYADNVIAVAEPEAKT